MKLKEIKTISKFSLFLLSITVLSGLSVLSMVGCKKTESAVNSDNEIKFSVGGMPNTKTAFSRTNSYQLIWIDGDQISIFCDQAKGDNNKQKADYNVTPKADSTKGTLSIADADSTGLRWGNAAIPHNLYAVYPSIAKSGGNVIKETAEGVFTFNFPKTQNCSKAGGYSPNNNTSKYMLKPNMYLAYMVAKQEELTQTKNVNLSFKPIATTLEITLQGAAQGDVVISGIDVNVNVKSLNENLVKESDTKDSYQIQFTAKYKDFYSDVSNALTAYSSGGVTNAIFNIRLSDGNYTLESGKSVTFTVFLPPIKSLDDVKVECLDANGYVLGTKQLFINSKYASPASKSFFTLPKFGSTNQIILDYYQWDAYATFDNLDEGWKSGSSGYHPGEPDAIIASQSCNGCPTNNDAMKYLGVDVYWDTNGPEYTLPNDRKRTTGLWVMKFDYIPKDVVGQTYRIPLTNVTDDIRNSGKYFFLPACGWKNNSNIRTYRGTAGYYWLDSPEVNSNGAALFFDKSYVKFSINKRDIGMIPMKGFDNTYSPSTAAEPIGITLKANKEEIEVGDNTSLTATVEYTDGSALKNPSGVSFVSDAPNVVEISGTSSYNPYAYGRAAGKAGITASIGEGNKKITSNKVTITVTSPTPAVIPVTEVTIEPETLRVTYEGVVITRTLPATVTPTNATNKTLSWSSSASNIVAVDQNGNISIKAVGTATITATANNGVSGQCLVIASAPTPAVIPVTGVTVAPPQRELYVNEEYTLTATVTPTNATNKNVKWTTNNSSIVSVDQNGKIKGLKVGTATITATAEDGSGKFGTCVVTVKAQTIPVTNVTVAPPQKELYVNEEYTLTATVTPTNATNKNVKWTTNNSSIVSVDQNGKIKGLKVGTATITATAEDGSGKFGTCVVTVKAPAEPALRLTISRSSITYPTTAQLTATYYPDKNSTSGGTPVTSSCSWSTTPSRDIVDNIGVVRAFGQPGTVTITATYNGCTSNSVSINIGLYKTYVRSNYMTWNQAMASSNPPAYSNSGMRNHLAKSGTVYFWDDNGPAYTFSGSEFSSSIDGIDYNDKVCTAGLWILKMSKSAGTATTLAEARTNGDYIFLPACGWFGSSGSFGIDAPPGHYWLSTPDSPRTGHGGNLGFYSGLATLSYYRTYTCYLVPLPKLE